MFNYKSNAKYLREDIKAGYDGSRFSLLDVHLNDKGPSVKIKLLNSFKDHHIAAKVNSVAVGFAEWASYNALWINFSIVMVNISLN